MRAFVLVLFRSAVTVVLGLGLPELSWGQTANAGADQTICSNGQTTLNGSAIGGTQPYAYSWSPATGLSDPSIANPVCTVNSTTAYTLTVTDASGNTNSDQVTITVLPAANPLITAADPIQSTTFNNVTTFFICGENSFTFDFTDASMAPANSTLSVNWGNGNSFNPPSSGWTSTQNFTLGLTQGTYSITAPNGCISTSNISMFVGIAPDGGAVADGNTNVCLGQPINASWTNIGNNPPGTNYILDWGDGTTDVFVHPPPVIVPHVYTESSCTQPDGQYCVSYEIINPCIPARTGQFCQVLVSEVPVASFTMSADTACVNTTVTFADASTGSQAPLCGMPNHIWSISPATYTLSAGSLGLTNGSNNPNNWTSGTQSLGVQFTAPGTYAITDVVGNNICGKDTLVRTICVEAQPVPSFTLNPLVGCSPLVANTTNNSIINGCAIIRTWEAAQVTQGCAPQPGSVAFNAQANAPQFTFTGQGTYEVTLTLENSCGTFEQTIEPITVNGPPIVDQAALPVICAGQGCVNPSATYTDCGAPITSYGWNFTGGTPASSNQQSPGQVCYTTPGPYVVTASATNACGTSTDVVDLVVSTLPLANAGSDVTICAGSSIVLNGSAIGGTAPYSYSWSPTTNLVNPASANPSASPSSTTTYTLTVTDAGGCVGTDQVFVTVTPPATANAGGPYTTCGTGPVSITAIGSGPGFWSTTAGAGNFADATSATTTFTPASATPGSINLTWTTNDPDGAGPCAAVTNTATLTVNAPATATASGPYTACSNAPVNIVATTNNAGTWTTNGAGTFANSTNASTTYTPGAGDTSNPVTITWTTTDPDGAGPCVPATVSTTIAVSIAPTANAGGPYTTCGTGPVSITAIGSGPGIWSTTAGAGNFADATSATTTFTPASATPGSINLTWTTNDPDGAGPCAAVTNTATLTVNAPASATTSGPYIACSNAPVNIVATTNNAGTWTTNGAGTFANSTSASTTYTPDAGDTSNPVTITWTTIDPDGGGPCVPAIVSTIITVDPAPTVLAGPDLTLCLNSGTIDLGGAPVNGTWSGNGVSTNGAFNPTVVGAFPLTYSFTDANNCTNSQQMTVTVNDAATAAGNGPYTTCGITAIQLNASANGSGQWSGGSGQFAAPGNTNTTYAPDLSEVGTTITLTWETFDPDGAGPCPGASATADLIINPPATAAPGGPYTICSSDVANVMVTSTPSGGTWTGGTGTIATPNNGSTTYVPGPGEAGTTVVLTWTTADPDGLGPCPQVTADVSVNVLEAAIAAANGPYAICGGAPIALSATTNGTGQWTGGVGSFTNATSPTTNYTPDPSELGTTITLIWETFDPDGSGPCPGASDDAELTITVPATAIAGGPYDVCSNSAVEVVVTTTPGAGSWTGGAGNILDATSPTTTYTPAPSEAGSAVTLTWITEDPDGAGPCEPEQANVTVNVLEAALALANGPYSVCGAQPITLGANTNGTGEWTGGTGTFANASDPNTTYTPALAEVGTSIQLTWSTNDPDGPGPCEGATDSADLVITVPATAIAGGPYDVCSNSTVEVAVNTTPGTGIWTGGSGTFQDTASPTTVYTPALGEAGTTVSLTWTTIDPDDVGPCPAVMAAVAVNVLAAATAEANGSYVTCGPDPVDLFAEANGSGSWTGGNGSFAVAEDVATSYTADPSEYGTTITLIWTTNDPDGAGPCPDAMDTADLVVNTLPVADAGLDVTLACGDTITGTATAGAGPDYTYSWSPTAGLISPSNAETPVTTSGTYTLLVTDANGCIDTDSAQVTVIGLETMAQAVDVEVCLFDAVDLEGVATDGLAPHSFTWTPVAYLTPPTGVGAIVSFSYTLPLAQDTLFPQVLHVVDAFGCADTDTINVTVHPLPVVVVGADTSLCAYDPPFDLTGDPLDGTWNPASTVDPASLPFGDNPFVYSYTDANNCTNTDELVVSVNEVPQADFSAPDTACVNTNVLFTNQSSCPTCTNIAYTWDFGDGSPASNLVSPQYSYADTGLYVVTLIAGSGFGCSDTIALPIRIIKVPEVGFSFTPEVGCGPLEVDLTNTSLGLPINYLWTIESFGTSALADPGPITFPVAPCDSIYYNITLSASNQCGTFTEQDSVKVFSPPQPLLVISADTVCSPFDLEAYNETVCAWATVYSWDFGDGSESNTQGLLVNHVYTADSLPETYTLTLSAQNLCGTVTSTNTVVVYPNTVTAFFNTAPLSGCPPLPVQFTQSLLGITFWTWNFGDGNTSQDQDPLYIYDEEGTYAISLIVSNGCAWDTMAQQVTVLSPPLFDFVAEPDTLCVLQPTSFTPSGENISGLAWAFGDGATSTLTAPSHAYAEAGQYDVALTAFSTTTGCPATVIHPVVVLNTPVASVTAVPDQGCAPLSVSFANATTAGDFFTWDFGDGNTSADASPTNLYVDAGTYSAQVIATNITGCVDTASAVITVFPVPIASFTYVMDTLPDPVLPVAFENLSEGATGYQWSFGDGGTSTYVHPDHVYQIGGDCSYSPSLIAINQYNCRDTIVRILDVPRDLRIWAPNAFTPDDNGLNETFVVQGVDLDLATAKLSIFDRWGRVIHESKGPSLSWDGRVNGTLAKNDVYVWKLKARMSCGYDEVERIGHVTLVR